MSLQGVCAGPQGGAAGVAEEDQDGMRVVVPLLSRFLCDAVDLGLRLVAFLSLVAVCVTGWCRSMCSAALLQCPCVCLL